MIHLCISMLIHKYTYCREIAVCWKQKVAVPIRTGRAHSSQLDSATSQTVPVKTVARVIEAFIYNPSHSMFCVHWPHNLKGARPLITFTVSEWRPPQAQEQLQEQVMWESAGSTHIAFYSLQSSSQLLAMAALVVQSQPWQYALVGQSHSL